MDRCPVDADPRAADMILVPVVDTKSPASQPGKGVNLTERRGF